jgi:hypothetical protein
MGPIKNDRVLKVHVVICVSEVICVSDRGGMPAVLGGRCFEIVVATARLLQSKPSLRSMKLFAGM